MINYNPEPTIPCFQSILPLFMHYYHLFILTYWSFSLLVILTDWYFHVILENCSVLKKLNKSTDVPDSHVQWLIVSPWNSKKCLICLVRISTFRSPLSYKLAQRGAQSQILGAIYFNLHIYHLIMGYFLSRHVNIYFNCTL